MHSEAQTLADDPDSAVFFALVDAVVEETVFVGSGRADDVRVLARDGLAWFIIAGKGEIVAAGGTTPAKYLGRAPDIGARLFQFEPAVIRRTLQHR
jgi:hypothetical protein